MRLKALMVVMLLMRPKGQHIDNKFIPRFIDVNGVMHIVTSLSFTKLPYCSRHKAVGMYICFRLNTEHKCYVGVVGMFPARYQIRCIGSECKDPTGWNGFLKDMWPCKHI